MMESLDGSYISLSSKEIFRFSPMQQALLFEYHQLPYGLYCLLLFQTVKNIFDICYYIYYNVLHKTLHIMKACLTVLSSSVNGTTFRRAADLEKLVLYNKCEVLDTKSVVYLLPYVAEC